MNLPLRLHAGIFASSLALAVPVHALDIEGVQNASLDQPRVNAALVLDGTLLTATTEDPLTGENEETLNIQAFYDTGASGVLLSKETADALGLPREPGVVFGDVGVGGTESFDVSVPVEVRLADFTPENSLLIDNPATYQSVYTHSFGPLRTQVIQSPADPLVGPLDVFGMPLFQNKTAVFDARALNNVESTLDTRIYDHGSVPDTVPDADFRVPLSFGDFSGFTTISDPTKSPALAQNPFIGPDPLADFGGGTASSAASTSPPGLRTTHNGQTRYSSWLFDTGAAASIISEQLAAEHGVTVGGTTFIQIGLDLVEVPELYQDGVPIEDQFYLSIGGVGGTTTVAGFWLDELSLPTVEGEEITYLRAPVLVIDITLQDPDTLESFTLDGVFGMNYLVATGFVDARTLFPSNLTAGAYDFFTYDAVTNELGLTLNPAFIPEPGITTLAVMGTALFALRRRR